MKMVNAVYRINTIDMNDLTQNKNEVLAGLSGYLKDIKLSNAPTTAPLNIPRIVGQTNDGMINVVMSNQSIEFAVVNAGAANDEVIYDSLMEAVDKIGSFFENYSESAFNFCGFSIQVKFDHDEINENAVDFVNSKIKGFDADLAIDNAFVRKCFIQGDYFINLTIKNDKQIKVMAPKQNAKPTGFEIVDEFIMVELDVNDKFSFLQKKDYSCEIEQALTLVEDVEKFYNEKLFNLVKNGSFDFFK